MKVLILEPGKIARAAEIEHTLESMQSVVEGMITAVYPFAEPVAVVANDEGLRLGLPLNRQMADNVILAGTCFICGLSEESFADLPDDLMERFLRQFYYPQIFVRVNDDIVPISYDPDEGEG